MPKPLVSTLNPYLTLRPKPPPPSPGIRSPETFAQNLDLIGRLETAQQLYSTQLAGQQQEAEEQDQPLWKKALGLVRPLVQYTSLSELATKLPGVGPKIESGMESVPGLRTALGVGTNIPAWVSVIASGGTGAIPLAASAVGAGAGEAAVSERGLGLDIPKVPEKYEPFVGSLIGGIGAARAGSSVVQRMSPAAREAALAQRASRLAAGDEPLAVGDIVYSADGKTFLPFKPQSDPLGRTWTEFRVSDPSRLVRDPQTRAFRYVADEPVAATVEARAMVHPNLTPEERLAGQPGVVVTKGLTSRLEAAGETIDRALENMSKGVPLLGPTIYRAARALDRMPEQVVKSLLPERIAASPLTAVARPSVLLAMYAVTNPKRAIREAMDIDHEIGLQIAQAILPKTDLDLRIPGLRHVNIEGIGAELLRPSNFINFTPEGILANVGFRSLRGLNATARMMALEGLGNAAIVGLDAWSAGANRKQMLQAMAMGFAGGAILPVALHPVFNLAGGALRSVARSRLYRYANEALQPLFAKLSGASDDQAIAALLTEIARSAREQLQFESPAARSELPELQNTPIDLGEELAPAAVEPEAIAPAPEPAPEVRAEPARAVQEGLALPERPSVEERAIITPAEETIVTEAPVAREEVIPPVEERPEVTPAERAEEAAPLEEAAARRPELTEEERLRADIEEARRREPALAGTPMARSIGVVRPPSVEEGGISGIIPVTTTAADLYPDIGQKLMARVVDIRNNLVNLLRKVNREGYIVSSRIEGAERPAYIRRLRSRGEQPAILKHALFDEKDPVARDVKAGLILALELAYRGRLVHGEIGGFFMRMADNGIVLDRDRVADAMYMFLNDLKRKPKSQDFLREVENKLNSIAKLYRVKHLLTTKDPEAVWEKFQALDPGERLMYQHFLDRDHALALILHGLRMRGHRWYANVVSWATKNFGYRDGLRFVDFLAAAGINTSPVVNLRIALHEFLSWKLGLYGDPSYTPLISPNRNISAQLRAVAAGDAPWGPKIFEYRESLRLDEFASAADRFGHAMTGATAKSPREIDALGFIHLAELVGRDLGLLPHEAQAALWVGYRSAIETDKPVVNRPFEELLEGENADPISVSILEGIRRAASEGRIQLSVEERSTLMREFYEPYLLARQKKIRDAINIIAARGGKVNVKRDIIGGRGEYTFEQALNDLDQYTEALSKFWRRQIGEEPLEELRRTFAQEVKGRGVREEYEEGGLIDEVDPKKWKLKGPMWFLWEMTQSYLKHVDEGISVALERSPALPIMLRYDPRGTEPDGFWRLMLKEIGDGERFPDDMVITKPTGADRVTVGEIRDALTRAQMNIARYSDEELREASRRAFANTVAAQREALLRDFGIELPDDAELRHREVQRLYPQVVRNLLSVAGDLGVEPRAVFEAGEAIRSIREAHQREFPPERLETILAEERRQRIEEAVSVATPDGRYALVVSATDERGPVPIEHRGQVVEVLQDASNNRSIQGLLQLVDDRVQRAVSVLSEMSGIPIEADFRGTLTSFLRRLVRNNETGERITVYSPLLGITTKAALDQPNEIYINIFRIATSTANFDDFVRSSTRNIVHEITSALGLHPDQMTVLDKTALMLTSTTFHEVTHTLDIYHVDAIDTTFNAVFDYFRHYAMNDIIDTFNAYRSFLGSEIDGERVYDTLMRYGREIDNRTIRGWRPYQGQMAGRAPPAPSAQTAEYYGLTEGEMQDLARQLREGMERVRRGELTPEELAPSLLEALREHARAPLVKELEKSVNVYLKKYDEWMPTVQSTLPDGSTIGIHMDLMYTPERIRDNSTFQKIVREQIIPRFSNDPSVQNLTMKLRDAFSIVHDSLGDIYVGSGIFTPDEWSRFKIHSVGLQAPPLQTVAFYHPVEIRPVPGGRLAQTVGTVQYNLNTVLDYARDLEKNLHAIVINHYDPEVTLTLDDMYVLREDLSVVDMFVPEEVTENRLSWKRRMDLTAAGLENFRETFLGLYAATTTEHELLHSVVTGHGTIEVPGTSRVYNFDAIIRALRLRHPESIMRFSDILAAAMKEDPFLFLKMEALTRATREAMFAVESKKKNFAGMELYLDDYDQLAAASTLAESREFMNDLLRDERVSPAEIRRMFGLPANPEALARTPFDILEQGYRNLMRGGYDLNDLRRKLLPQLPATARKAYHQAISATFPERTAGRIPDIAVPPDRPELRELVDGLGNVSPGTARDVSRVIDRSIRGASGEPAAGVYGRAEGTVLAAHDVPYGRAGVAEAGAERGLGGGRPAPAGGTELQYRQGLERGRGTRWDDIAARIREQGEAEYGGPAAGGKARRVVRVGPTGRPVETAYGAELGKPLEPLNRLEGLEVVREFKLIQDDLHYKPASIGDAFIHIDPDSDYIVPTTPTIIEFMDEEFQRDFLRRSSESLQKFLSKLPKGQRNPISKAIRTTIEWLGGKSATARHQFEKLLVAYQMAVLGGDARKTYVLELLRETPFNEVISREGHLTGFVRVRPKGKPEDVIVSFYTVLENPSRFELNEAQKLYVKTYHRVIDDVTEEARAVRLELREIGQSEEGVEHYIPRAVRGKDGMELELPYGGSRPGSRAPFEKPRAYRTVEDGIAHGVIYEHPLAALEMWLDRMNKRIASQHMLRFLNAYSVTPRELALRDTGYVEVGDKKISPKVYEALVAQQEAKYELNRAKEALLYARLGWEKRARGKRQLYIPEKLSASQLRAAVDADPEIIRLKSQIAKLKQARNIPHLSEEQAKAVAEYHQARKEYLKLFKGIHGKYVTYRYDLPMLVSSAKDVIGTVGKTELHADDIRAKAEELLAKRKQMLEALKEARGGQIQALQEALANRMERVRAEVRGAHEIIRQHQKLSQKQLVARLQDAAQKAEARYRNATEDYVNAVREFAALVRRKESTPTVPTEVFPEGVARELRETQLEMGLPGDIVHIRHVRGLPGLQSRLYPDTVAKTLEELTTEWYGPIAVRSLEWANNWARRFRASTDFGFMFMQGLPVLAYNPKVFAKAVFLALRSFVNPSAYGEFLASKRYLLDEAFWHIGGISDNEYFAGFRKPAPVVGESEWSFADTALGAPVGTVARKLGRVGGDVMARFSISFDSFLDAAKLLLWESADRANWLRTPEDKVRYGRFIRNITGTTSTRRLVVPPQMRAIEGLLLFSPRFTRSGFAMAVQAAQETAKLLKDQTVRKEILERLYDPIHTWNMLRKHVPALTALMTLISGAYVLYAGTKQLMYEMGYSDEPLKPEDFDPTSGGRFLSIKFGNNYIGLGGTVRSLMQFAGYTLSAIRSGDLNRFLSTDSTSNDRNNPILKYIRTRLSPFGTMTVDKLYGKTYLGDDVADYRDWLSRMPDSMLPFAITATMEAKGDAKERAAALGAQMIGMRSFPESAIEDLDRAVRDIIKDPTVRGWNDLTFYQQTQLLERHPQIRKLLRQYQIETWNDYRQIAYSFEQAKNALAQRFLATMQRGGVKLTPEDITAKEYREQLENLNYARRAALNIVRGADPITGVGGDIPDRNVDTNPRKRLLRAYYMAADPKLYTRPDGTVDWGLKTSLEEEFRSRLSPEEERILDEELSGAAFNPVEQELKRAQRMLRPYWNLYEEAAKRVGLPNRLALNALPDNDPRLKRYRRVLDDLQVAYRKSHPEADRMLVFWGYVSEPVTEREPRRIVLRSSLKPSSLKSGLKSPLSRR
jgi:hypothetical protein